MIDGAGGPELFVIKDDKGRGVYAKQKIPSGATIELCEVILLSKTDTEKIHTTALHDYYFIWDVVSGTSAIALGRGSLYNHSEKPNAEFLLDHEFELIKFHAIEDIQPGEEVCINYIDRSEKEFNLWFDPQ